MLRRLHCSVLVAVWIVCGTWVSPVRAETEPPEVAQARELIKDNGRTIVYFALPSYKYVSTGYNDYRRLSDGFELTYTFETKSTWRTNTTHMAFYFDTSGQFDHCRSVRSTTHYTPFTDAVGKKLLAKQRAFMADYPPVKDSRALLKISDEANSKALCELYLKLEQAKKNAAPGRVGARTREPVLGLFTQVAPVPARVTEFERSTNQPRAVVLIHGYRPELDRFLLSRPMIQDWQEADSFMVKILARDADVYAFAYGQNAPVQDVAGAAELADGVARLKKMGYGDIVLLGYSAGGLVCRYFVEDHPDAGVTKVVQVCAPNTGVFWAKFTSVIPLTQKPFVASLTAGNCKLCQQTRDGRTIPGGVAFVCVVGDAIAHSDWVVPCRSQWSDDLQEQGIPAIRLKVCHLDIVQKPESIAVVARAVREPAPRWDRQRVLQERHDILRD